MSDVYTPTRYKLTIEDYHKLGEVGILNEDSRVELIEGELIQMAPIGGPHLWTVNTLNRLLILSLGDLGDLSIQNPVLLPPYSEPQPDFVIVRPGTASRERRVPSTEDVILVVEVADTTLRYDRGTKLRLYARFGIPEFWIVNVQDECVEIHTTPKGDTYATRRVVRKGESLSPGALPAVSIEVSALFAPAR